MKQLARAQFASFSLTLPVNWQQPQGEPAAAHYDEAFHDDERAVPPPSGSPPLFRAATANRYHTESAQELSDRVSDFIDGMCEAICAAWSTWQSAASMSGITVSAVSASGGSVSGPPWMGPILGQAPRGTAQEARYARAIAQAVSDGWQSYQGSILVPGLPFYPAFAAFAGPMAPPTPNVPVPVAALTQVTAPLSKSSLKGQIIGNLGDPQAQHHVELFDCIADAFEKCFQQWQGATQVTNVLGTGPVPSFNPPWVPVGPVVGGSATMAPGGLV